MLKSTRTLLVAILLALPLAAYGQTTATVETVQFQSKLIGRLQPYRVVLPPDYYLASARATRYPVLYLLHGLTGRYSDWVDKSKLAEHAARHRFIIITPEGQNGWYTDSPVVTTEKYESYILQELIPDVQKRYRTNETRGARAIAGLSMGGYGALKFGLKYPDTFAFAASMSGAVAAAQFTGKEVGVSATGELPANLPPFLVTVFRSIRQAFGPEGDPTRSANDIFQIARELTEARIKELPFLYFDCGTEDGLLKSNKELAEIFVTKKIAHEYRQLPGAHDWPYWDRQIREVLRVADARMALASAAQKSARGTGRQPTAAAGRVIARRNQTGGSVSRPNP